MASAHKHSEVPVDWNHVTGVPSAQLGMSQERTISQNICWKLSKNV